MGRNQLLEKFGKIFVTEVRDESIEKYEMTVTGLIKSAQALELSEKLQGFNDEQLSIINEVVQSSIDNVLHNFLWMIEQHEDDINLICLDDDCVTKVNINDVSDGLTGEIYTEDGWIEKYSKYRE